jgi:hypothetical protein
VAQPVILATQEAKIRRIDVCSQPGQVVCETLSQKPFTAWLKVKALSQALVLKKKKVV